METTFSVLLASHRPESDTANNQNAATEAAARMRGRPILAPMPVLLPAVRVDKLSEHPIFRCAGRRCSDSSDCAAGERRTDRQSDYRMQRYWRTGWTLLTLAAFRITSGNTAESLRGEYGLVTDTDGSAPFPGQNGHGHTVF